MIPICVSTINFDECVGCKQDILDILVTLFSTWKQEKISLKNF
jgi:hypothetical protein